MKKAWEGGWRPGMDVPKEFQTPDYSKIYASKKEEEKQLGELEKMLADLK